MNDVNSEIFGNSEVIKEEEFIKNIPNNKKEAEKTSAPKQLNRGT